MKRSIILLALLTAAGCYGEHILQQKTFSMDVLTHMRPTSSGGMKYVTFEKNGRTGTCMRFNTMDFPQNMTRISAFGRKKEPMLMTMNWTHAKLELANDIVELSIYVKGKGAFVFGLYHYDQHRRNIGVQNSKEFKINSPDKWEKITTRFTLPLERNYYINSCDMLPGVIVFQKSDLLMDDFTFTIYSGSLLYSPDKKALAKKAPAAVKKASKAVKKAPKAKSIKAGSLSLAQAKIHAMEELNNGKRSKMAANKVLQNKNGIELSFDLKTPGQDAAFVTVDLPKMGKFNRIKTSIDARYKGNIRPFIVVEDAGSELHYFPLIRNRLLALQRLPGSGQRVFTTVIDLKNARGADRVSQRWGGDRNQRIDFPVKRITLGVDDLQDGKNAKGKITFKSLEFIHNAK